MKPLVGGVQLIPGTVRVAAHHFLRILPNGPGRILDKKLATHDSYATISAIRQGTLLDSGVPRINVALFKQ